MDTFVAADQDGASMSGETAPRQRGLPKLAAPMLAAGLALVATVLLCEGLLRVFALSQTLARPTSPPWDWLVYDPVLGVTNRPGYTNPRLGFAINSLGLKGGEIERRKPSSTIRIACLGDSGTFGIWKERPLRLRADASYPDALSSRLRAAGVANVEVINAGASGYTSAHGLRQLIARLMPLRPDIITVRFGQNEHALGGNVSGWETGPIRTLLPAGAYGWELTRLGFHGLGLARPRSERPGDRRLSVEQFAENLRRFVEIASENGARLLLLDYPYRPVDQTTPPAVIPPDFGGRTVEELYAVHEEYQAAQRTVAAETDTPLLRTAGRLQQFAPPMFTDYDLVHPSGDGYELLGELLLEKLRALGWLSPPAT